MKSKIVTSLGIMGALVSGSALADHVSHAQHPATTHHNKQVQHLANLSKSRGHAAQDMNLWFKKIKVSGGANVDFNLAGSFQPDMVDTFSGVNTQRVSVNDAYLNFDAKVNCWTDARVGVSYLDNVSWAYEPSQTNGEDAANHSSHFDLDHAYINFANKSKTPFFVQVGKNYLQFGHYNLHPMTQSMTQVLSEANVPNITVGMVSQSGLHGTIFGFQNIIPEASNSHQELSFGASLAFGQKLEKFSYNAGISYVDNMSVVRSIASGFESGSYNESQYTNKVNALALNGDVQVGPFGVQADYVSALKGFESSDIFSATVASPKPWAFGIQADYAFKLPQMNNRQNTVYVGYQRSDDATMAYLPKTRYVVGYTHELSRNTNVSLEWNHDKAYGSSQYVPTDYEASGNKSNRLTARVAVKF